MVPHKQYTLTQNSCEYTFFSQSSMLAELLYYAYLATREKRSQNGTIQYKATMLVYFFTPWFSLQCISLHLPYLIFQDDQTQI